MRSGRAASPATGSDALQGARARRAKKLPGAGLRAAAVLAALVVASGCAVSSDANVVDVIAGVMFTTILDAAYAVHAVLSLSATSSIDNTDSLELNSARGITTFESGGHTYAAVAAYDDNGVQILNVTNPSNVTAAGSIDNTDSLELRNVGGITTFESGGHTYAAVAAYLDDGVQILNITNPSNVTAAGSIANTDNLELNGAWDITTFESGGHTYAAVAAFDDNGVQILNITNPSNVTAAGSIANTDSIELEGPVGITTFKSGDHTYAAVAAFVDNGVQILNVTNPSNVTAAGSIANTDSLELDGVYGITTFKSGDHTYAAVVAYSDDGVQILNVTNPSNVTAAGSIANTDSLELKRAAGITTFKSGGHTYAAVAAYLDDGVQILDVTNPSNVTAAGSIANTDNLELNGPWGITTFESGGHTYLAVAAYDDNGVQIIRVDIMSDTTDSAVDFVTTWQTTTADESITIPGTGTYAVDWGDGTTPTAASGRVTHTYTTAGTYTVSISGGLTRINLGDDSLTNSEKLQSIEQWGNMTWGSMKSAFEGASNMTYNATDAPDLSGVTDMSSMFVEASLFDGNLSAWDVSTVTKMQSMFSKAAAFDGNVSTWDVSKVTDMSYMFASSAFDGDVSAWDVSSVTLMNDMFNGADSFNGDVSSWDVSGVTSMSNMFNKVADFDDDLSGWDVSRVASMSGMFSSTDSFNGDISSWNVSGVTDMSEMFSSTGAFNGTISSWNVSGVTDMSDMFYYAEAFNQPISSWNVSSVTDMSDMFYYAEAFNQPIGSWNVSSVTDMEDMFNNANAFDQNLGKWYATLNSTSIGRADVPGVVGSVSAQNTPLKNHTPTYWIGAGADKDRFEIVGGNLLNMTSVVAGRDSYAANVTANGTNVFENGNNWRVFEVTLDSTPFVTTWRTTTADESITIPGTGTYAVDWGDGTTPTSESGTATHEYATADTYTVSISGGLTRIHFGGSYSDSANDVKLRSIAQWGDIAWTTMRGAFQGTTNMAYDAADSPDLSGVTDMNSMFQTSSINGDISGWDVSGVTDMSSMFIRASAFNGNVSGWDVSAVTDMSRMFSDASLFNGNVSGWDVSAVQKMNRMFSLAEDFNQNLNDWNVSSVTDMSRMFSGASLFNGNVSGWDVSAVQNMNRMFSGASLFNGDVSGWDVSAVTDMSGMFRTTDDFNQDLSTWDVSGVTDMSGMFETATSFNGDVSTWDVSKVTDMSGMFAYGPFNQPISTWNVSKVTDMSSMFEGATKFNQDISTWNVSAVDAMSEMFIDAEEFDQNLGKWYAVPADTSYGIAEASLNVTTISAQNQVLISHNLTYGTGTGGNSTLFNMTGSTLMFKATPDARGYTVNVTAAGTDVFGSGNHRILTITVTGNAAPVLVSIGSKSVNELVALSFTATATDGDGDTLTYSLTGTPPTGAAITDAGAFSWTPSELQDGTHDIIVQVSDGAGGSDSEVIEVTVAEVNVAPMLVSIGDKSVNELDELTFTATATDDDTIGGMADTLAFSLTGTVPTGATINSNTGAFSWTPTASQAGVHTVTVQVTDGASATDSEDVTVTVSDSNMNPVLASIGSKSVNELVALSFTATATDGDGDTLTYSLTSTPPTGAAITDAGAFSWTPSELQDGTHDITVQVSDGAGGSDSEVIEVTVAEVNVAPMLVSIGDKSVNELDELTFTATATDDDTIGGMADTLAFSLTGTVPTGATINSNTGAFSWTPTASQAGVHTVTVQVTDGASATDSEDVTVTVSDSNMNPVLASIGSKSVNELVALSFTATATDGDGDTLTYSLTSTPPTGAAITDAGAFSWTPSELQDGTHDITVQVSDGAGGSDSEVIEVTVAEVNVAPMLVSIGDKSVNELDELTFTATATDDDTIGGMADTLAFSLTGTVPTGATINSNTGAFSWTPSESQDGSHTITIQVRDGVGATDSESITVTVAEVPTDPVLNPIGPKSVNMLDELTFTATASDVDVISGTADTLAFSLTGAPTGASINQNTGVFSWTPTASQTGQHPVTVQVEDGAGATDSEVVTITVTESNENPTLNPIGPKSVNELDELTFTATASDDDAGDTLEFTLVGTPPTGASITPNGAFSWTPTERQDGTHSITVRVSDGNGGTASETVTVTVNEINTSPVLGSIGSQGVNRPGTLTFMAAASDGDVINGADDALEFSLTGAPTGASMDSVTGMFSWTPTAGQVGTHTVTVTVADGAGTSDSETVTMTVTEGGTNEAPVLDSIGPQEIDELGTLGFNATATDGDGDSLEFTLAGNRPHGASMTPGGAFSWTPDQSQDGDYSITVRVSDGRGGTDSEVVSVTVNDIAPLPVSARASSSAITLTLSEVVTSSGTGPNGFSVEGDGDPVSVGSITGSGTNTLTLSLNGTISRGATLSYDESSGNVTDEGDKDGNDVKALATFDNMTISFQSKSKSSSLPPAIAIGSQGHPQGLLQAARQVSDGPIRPVPTDDTRSFPLVINQNGYALQSHASTVMPTSVAAGQPVTITVTMYDPTDIAYFAIYLNLQGDEVSHLQSDTQVIWDSGQVRIIDPNGLIRNATVTISVDPDDPTKKTVTLTVSFSEGMGVTNMVVRTWNAGGQITTVQIFDALDVRAPEPEPAMVDPEPGAEQNAVDPEPAAMLDAVDPEPAGQDSADRSLLAIRMWSGFEPESITDAQLLASLGLDYPGVDIPSWVMTELGTLTVKGDITVEQFRTALEYVLEHS